VVGAIKARMSQRQKHGALTAPAHPPPRESPSGGEAPGRSRRRNHLPTTAPLPPVADSSLESRSITAARRVTLNTIGRMGDTSSKIIGIRVEIEICCGKGSQATCAVLLDIVYPLSARNTLRSKLLMARVDVKAVSGSGFDEAKRRVAGLDDVSPDQDRYNRLVLGSATKMRKTRPPFR
jgi:hypothetical protein